MKATQQLHDLGQSLWLDNITRGLLTSGTLGHYISELSLTGLTSNPTIFDQAIRNADFYDADIRKKALADKSGEALFFELALEDLTQAADLFRPVHDATGEVDGRVSLEVSPLLAETGRCRRKAATPAVGQYRHQGSSSLRYPLHSSARGSGYHQHHAREDASCLR